MENINHLQYTGSTEQLSKVWAWLVVMNILTLGIYSFWGKTMLRQYLARNFILADNNFMYHGTSKQLGLGFLTALPLWLLLILAYKIFADTALENAYAVFLTIIVIFLTFVGLFSSLRYRITHTTWRGMQATMDGNAWHYGACALWMAIVSLFSLGLMLGWMDHNLYKNKLNKITIQGLEVKYIGEAQDLFRINWITLLLAIPTLWLSRIWYTAYVRRYVYNHTYIGTYKIHNTEQGQQLVKLFVWGFATTLFSLGLLYPLVVQWKMQYIAKYFAIIGDLTKIKPTDDQTTNNSNGEGIYDIMDLETNLW